jgi:hypothetical protein
MMRKRRKSRRKKMRSLRELSKANRKVSLNQEKPKMKTMKRRMKNSRLKVTREAKMPAHMKNPQKMKQKAHNLAVQPKIAVRKPVISNPCSPISSSLT